MTLKIILSRHLQIKWLALPWTWIILAHITCLMAYKGIKIITDKFGILALHVFFYIICIFMKRKQLYKTFFLLSQLFRNKFLTKWYAISSVFLYLSWLYCCCCLDWIILYTTNWSMRHQWSRAPLRDHFVYRLSVHLYVCPSVCQ